MLASDESRLAIVQLLLAAGASVEATGERGDTAMHVTCKEGHLQLTQLLCAYGAHRTATDRGGCTPEDVARDWRSYHPPFYDPLLAWFAATKHWTTPLHHLSPPPTLLPPERVRSLLRTDGTDIHARAPGAADAPSPVELARAQPHPRGAAAALVLRAAEPWSPSNHELFPAAARAHAVFVRWLGPQLARSLRVAGSGGLADVWVPFVMPHTTGITM